MEKRSGIDAVRNFWEQVWQSPQTYDAIDDLVVEDFVFISGGRRIEGRDAFKKWAEDFSAAIGNFERYAKPPPLELPTCNDACVTSSFA